MLRKILLCAVTFVLVSCNGADKPASPLAQTSVAADTGPAPKANQSPPLTWECNGGYGPGDDPKADFRHCKVTNNIFLEAGEDYSSLIILRNNTNADIVLYMRGSARLMNSDPARKGTYGNLRTHIPEPEGTCPHPGPNTEWRKCTVPANDNVSFFTIDDDNEADYELEFVRDTSRPNAVALAVSILDDDNRPDEQPPIIGFYVRPTAGRWRYDKNFRGATRANVEAKIAAEIANNPCPNGAVGAEGRIFRGSSENWRGFMDCIRDAERVVFYPLKSGTTLPRAEWYFDFGVSWKTAWVFQTYTTQSSHRIRNLGLRCNDYRNGDGEDRTITIGQNSGTPTVRMRYRGHAILSTDPRGLNIPTKHLCASAEPASF